MRLSSEVRDRLDRLQSTGDPRLAVRLLQEIGASGESAALPVLAAFLLTDDPAVAEAAAGAAGRLLAEAPPSALPALDAQLRKEGGYSRSFGNYWRTLGRGDVERLEPSLLSLAASHHSGYVREAAVRRLALARDGRELPFLLVRINDWVRTVAELARSAVEARLHPGYAPHLVASLPLLLFLDGPSRRRPSGSLVAAAAAALRNPRGIPALLDGLAPHRDREVRRACFSIALDALPLADMVARGLADLDPAIRVRAARRLADVPPESRAALAGQAQRDPFFPVRRLAYQELLRGEDAVSFLEEALLDVHAGIRGAARELDGGDLADFYREALAREGNTTAGALAGLGETGAPEDALLALPYLRHPSVRVRTAAARAVGRLDAAGHADALLEVVATGSRRPAAEATAALRSCVHRLGARKLRHAFGATGMAGRVRLLALFEQLPKWESLAELLEVAAAAGEEPVVQAVRERVLKWLVKSNRSYARPAPGEIERARAALGPLRERFPGWTAQQLDLALSTAPAPTPAAPAPAGRPSPRARDRS